jgi:hypothetical protein
MKAYGSKRTYHDARVVQAGNGKKIKFTTGVKSRKQGRKQENKDAQTGKTAE